MKKLLAFFAALCIILQSMSAFAVDFYDVTDDAPLNKALGLLTYCKIINGFDDNTFRPEENITRGDFAVAVAHMLGFNENKNKDNVYFYDVPNTHYASGSIAQLVEQGFVSGYGDGYYGISDPVSVTDAYALMLKILGYKKMVEVYGGYPNGVMKLASELELDDSVRGGQTATRRDVAVILYNTMHSNMAQLNINNGNVTVLKDSNTKTFLKQYWDMDWIEGTVNGIKNTDLYEGTDTTIEQIVIDNEVYTTTMDASEDFLGRKVRAYYVGDVGDEDIVYICKDVKNKEITIGADNIDSISEDFKVSYTPEGEKKSKSISIADNASVIYNGVALTSYTVDDFIFDDGNITFVFTDTDSKADVVLINSYELFVVGAVDTTGKKVYDLYDKTHILDIDSENYSYFLLKNDVGQEINIGNIKEKDILSVRASKGDNDKVLEIIDSKNIVEGSLNSIGDDSKTIVIDDKTYNVNKQYLDKKGPLTIGYYRFYLDNMGNVAYSESMRAGTNKKVGYIIRCVIDDEKECLIMKLLCEDGTVETFDCEARIKIDGTTYSDMALAYTVLVAGNGSVKPQIVVYGFSGSGKINYIDTVTQGEKEDENNLSVSIPAGSYKCKNNTKTIAGKGLYNASTLTFKVPVGEAVKLATDADYAVVKPDTMNGNTNVQTFKLSKSVEYEQIALITFTSGKTPSTTANPMLIKSISQGINADGEAVEVVSLFSTNGTSTYLTDTNYKPSETRKVGDLVQVARNSLGELVNMTIYTPTNPANPFIDQEFLVLDAYAIEKKGSVLRIGYEKSDSWLLTIPAAKVMVYDKTKTKVDDMFYVGTINDISTYEYGGADCDEVIVHFYYSDVRQIFVIKNK